MAAAKFVRFKFPLNGVDQPAPSNAVAPGPRDEKFGPVARATYQPKFRKLPSLTRVKRVPHSAQNLRTARPNQVAAIPDNLTSILGPKIRRIGVIGDGTCFYHAVLMCLSPEYRRMELESQEIIGTMYRNYLADRMSKQEYGALVDFHNISMKKYKKRIENLRNTHYWEDWEGWQTVMYIEKVNVFVVKVFADEFACNQLPVDMAKHAPPRITISPLREDVPTIIVGAITPGHYCCIFEQGEDETLDKFIFNPEDEVCKAIRARYPICCDPDKKEGPNYKASKCHPHGRNAGYHSRDALTCLEFNPKAKHKIDELREIASSCRLSSGGSKMEIKRRIVALKKQMTRVMEEFEQKLQIQHAAAVDLFSRFRTVEQLAKYAQTEPATIKNIVALRWLPDKEREFNEGIVALGKTVPKIVHQHYILSTHLLRLLKFGIKADQLLRGADAKLSVDQIMTKLVEINGKLPEDDVEFIQTSVSMYHEASTSDVKTALDAAGLTGPVTFQCAQIYEEKKDDGDDSDGSDDGGDSDNSDDGGDQVESVTDFVRQPAVPLPLCTKEFLQEMLKMAEKKRKSIDNGESAFIDLVSDNEDEEDNSKKRKTTSDLPGKSPKKKAKKTSTSPKKKMSVEDRMITQRIIDQQIDDLVREGRADRQVLETLIADIKDPQMIQQMLAEM